MLKFCIDRIRQFFHSFSVYDGNMGYFILIFAGFPFTFQYSFTGIQETGGVDFVIDVLGEWAAFLTEIF